MYATRSSRHSDAHPGLSGVPAIREGPGQNHNETLITAPVIQPPRRVGTRARRTRLIRLAMLAGLGALGLAVGVGAAHASAAELIPDNSFETTPFPGGYNAYHATVGQAAVSNAPDGTHVAKIARSAGTSYTIDYATAVANTAAGEVYDASDYVEAANSGTAGKPIYLAIREENQSGTIIATARSATVNLTSTGFQHITTSYTVKNSGDKLDLYAIQQSAGSGNAFYDDLLSLQPHAATDTTAPNMPTSLSGIAGDTTASLTWSASTDNVGVTGYNVYRDGAKVGSTATTGYVDTGLTDGVQYSYTVTAYDQAGNESAQSSPAVNATPTDTTAPSVPTGLTATPGDTTVNLTWTASTDNTAVAGYDVYRNGTKVGTTTGTSYNNTGLTDGTQYTYTVDAYDAAGNTSAQSSPLNATPTSGGGGGARTVPASPSGPPIPTGGWRPEFADAFQACVTFTSMPCSAGYPRTDTAWAPQTKADGNSNPNEKGVVAFEPGNLDITSQGFVTTCANTANLGDQKTCGQMLMNGGPAGTNGSAPAAPNPFHMDLSSGTWAIQYQAQLPADQGNLDPGIWENGPSGTPEIDNAEYFGMHKQPSGSNTWCGMGWAFIAVPYGGSQSGTGDNEYWCQAGGPNFDPSTAEHTYTMYFSGGSYTGYIDGTQVTSGTYSVNSSAFKLIAGMSMRTDAATGQVYALPSAGAKLTIPYIAVYEAASANNTGTNGPMIEPGTTVG
jgi:chitodextrinase